MDQVTLSWIALVSGALATGAAFVGLLVVRRSSELLVAATGFLAFALSSGAYISLVNHYGRFDAMLFGFAFIVASVGGGYALASSALDRLAREPAKPAPLAVPPTETDRGPAVVVVSCVEPPAYEPAATATMLQMLTDEGLIDASMGALPFLFFAQKARYRAIGGESPSTGQLQSVAEKLSDSLPELPVAWASCYGPNSLPNRVRDLAEKGYSPIVVAELAVADSGHIAEAKNETRALHLDTCGVDVRHTAILADSERAASAVAMRVHNTVDNPSTTGVVLVGHGQPEGRAHKNPEFDLEESRFLNRVRLLLAERGVDENRIRIAWAEWRSPDVSSSVRHLAALGCARIVVVPACYPLDTIGTRLDLEIAVRQARVDESVTVLTLPAWRDDSLVVEELRARIVALMAEQD